MSVINKKPFIIQVLETLSVQQVETLAQAIDGQGSEPIFRSLLAGSPNILKIQDAGIKPAEIEVARPGTAQRVYQGYLIYTGNEANQYCVLIHYSDDMNQGLSIVNMKFANGNWSHQVLPCELSITELRSELNDLAKAEEKQAVDAVYDALEDGSLPIKPEYISDKDELITGEDLASGAIVSVAGFNADGEMVKGPIPDGSPKGVYSTLEALQTAYPTGAEGIYVVQADGHWYYWNGSSWTDGGVYLSSINAVPETRTIAGIDLSNDITKNELNEALGNDLIKEKVDFITGKQELSWVQGYYNRTNGLLVETPTQPEYGHASNWIPYSFFDLIDNISLAQTGTNFILLKKDGIYVGYIYNGNYFLPDQTQSGSPIPFDEFAFSMISTSDDYLKLSIYTLYKAKEEVYDLSNDFEWYIGFYNFTTGVFASNSSYRCTQKKKSKKLPFLQDQSFLYETNVWISLYLAGTYVGYWLNGTFYGTNMVRTRYVAFDEYAINCPSNTSYSNAKLLSKEMYIQNQWYGKKVVVIGDSITYGAYTPIGGTSPDQVAYPTYVQVIGEVLGMNAVNYGISSTTISSQGNPNNPMCVRYANMDNDADLIIVAGGTNDYGLSTPMGTIADTTDVSFYGALRVLCDGLITKYPNKRIVFVTPLHRNTETANSRGYTLDDYRNAIKEVCELYGIKVIDGKSLGINAINTTWLASYIVDGVHLNPNAHLILGNNLANVLKAL